MSPTVPRRERPGIAEEPQSGARQNGAMALSPRLFRTAAGLIVLAAAAACSATAYDSGDAAFRRGDYLGAWHAYQAAGDPAADPVLAQRLARAHWFLLEDGLRTLLATGHEVRAIALLPELTPQVPPDRAQELIVLEARARAQLGARHISRAEELLEASEPDAALRELTLALSWNPEDDLAANLFAATTERLAREHRLADEFYFEAMDHLREGDELRARTSFHHSATISGMESRAQKRYEALTEDLAAESRAEARMMLDAGLLGPAFQAIRTADRLDPENPELKELLETLEVRVNSAMDLLAGDLAIRGGRADLAAEILAELQEWDLPAHRGETRALAERQHDLALDKDYRFGRALELDEQVQRAAEVYRSIVAREGGNGWADSELRLVQLSRRLELAESAYRAALAAEQAGDADAYRARLEETVRAASDYSDALARLAAVRAAAVPGAENAGR